MAVEQVGIAPAAFVESDAIVVDHLLVTSPEAVQSAHAYAARTGDRNVARHVEALIEIGGKAVAIGGSTLDVDEIKRSVDRFTARVESSAESSVNGLRAAVEGATNIETGAIATSVSRALGDLAQQLDLLLKGEESPVRQAIGSTVKSLTDQALEEIQRAIKTQEQGVRSVFSTDAPDSPLSALKRDLLQAEREGRKEIQERLVKLQELVAVGQEHESVMARTAVKGLDFEADVVVALTDLAHGAGDALEPTGGVPGTIPRCKVGDAVVTLNGGAARGDAIRIVVEAKDRKLTCGQWRDELEQARKNRAAAAAVGVAKVPGHIPGEQRIYILDPTHVVIAFDPAKDDPSLLYTVYHLVRAQAVADVLESADASLDVNEVRRTLSGALETLEEFGKIDKAVGSARTQLGTIEKVAQKMRDSLREELESAVEILETAAQ